jgi:hypothetical protein
VSSWNFFVLPSYTGRLPSALRTKMLDSRWPRIVLRNRTRSATSEVGSEMKRIGRAKKCNFLWLSDLSEFSRGTGSWVLYVAPNGCQTARSAYAMHQLRSSLHLKGRRLTPG